MSFSGKRGSGACPNCKTSYFNRYKPRLCANCDYFIGGSYEPKTKKAKIIVPPAVSVSTNVVSVSTTNRNDRCFVTRESNGMWICLQESCKKRRAVVCNSGRTQFRCEHIDKAIDQLSEPHGKHEINAEKLMIYPCSSSVRNEIRSNLDDLAARFGTPPVIEIPGGVFSVYANATASNPLGFCHVKRNNDFSLACSGKNCRSIISKAKQEKTRALCIHGHTLLCALNIASSVADSVETSSELGETSELGEASTATETQVKTGACTSQRESTLMVKDLLVLLIIYLTCAWFIWHAI